jgi:sugar lactone lactonase YvrE
MKIMAWVNRMRVPALSITLVGRKRMNPGSSSRIFRLIGGLALLCMAVLLPFQSQTDAARPETGRSEIVLSLAPGNHPEGIAVDATGYVFVGNRLNTAEERVNEILRIAPDGTTVVFATLPNSSLVAPSLLGLAVDPVGDLYAAFASFDENSGVWRVGRDGAQIERLPGSAGIAFPNALTFDPMGNLYVTDSTGAIWRARPGGALEVWVEHPLLEPFPEDPFGFPLPGANGIAFYPPDILYVANTEKSLIAKVRIELDGSAGAVEAVTPAFAVPTADGIAVDVNGHIHAVLPGFLVLGTSPLVRVDPETGAITPTVTDPEDADRFDTPLSVAFGGGRWGVTTVLVTNGDLPVVPGGPGPGVVQVEVGVPGFPVR